MATKKPRFVVTLSEQNYLTLKALAELRGVSASAVINQMLSEARPALRSLLALAKEDPRQADLVELLERVEGRVGKTLRGTFGELRKAAKAGPKRPRRPR